MCRRPSNLFVDSDFTPFLAKRGSHRVPEIAGGGTAGVSARLGLIGSYLHHLADKGGRVWLALSCSAMSIAVLCFEALQAEDSRRHHETSGSLCWSRPGREAIVLVGSYLHDFAGVASDQGKVSCLFRVARGDFR